MKPGSQKQARSWPLTIISLLLFFLVLTGLIVIWRYIGHDPFIIFTIMVPATLVAMFFLVAAINGRKQVVYEAFEGVMWLFVWWR